MRELRETFWLPLAQGLPLGDTVRVAHPSEPNSRASVVIRHTSMGYSAWDFRNRQGDWVDKTIIFSLIEEESLNKLGKPEDMTPLRELEVFFRKYIESFLYSKGITADMYIKAGKQILFSEETGRLILECHATDGEEVSSYYVGRDLTGRSQAKYLSYREKQYQRHDIVKGTGSKIVLTEDSFSAVKIFYATGLTCVALSGTMLSKEVLYICSDFEEVVVWLDGDEAGITGAKEALKELRGVVNKVRNVNVLGKDPKDLQINDIINLIEGEQHDN